MMHPLTMRAALLGQAAVPAFDPLSLSPALWLKADAGLFQDTLFTVPAVNDADPIGGWQDQSGNGRHATQTTVSRRPTLKLAIQNGRAVVRCDGIANTLVVTVPQVLPLYIYASYGRSAGGVSVFAGRSANGPAMYAGEASVLRPEVYWNGASATWGSDITGFHIVKWRVKDATECAVSVDGGAEVVADPLGTLVGNWNSLFADPTNVQFFAGDAMDILCFTGQTLTAQNDSDLRAWMKARAGTP